MTSVVTVLGATGTTGRLVAQHVLEAGHGIRRASRTSPVRFDWDAPTTWAPAVSGATAVYLVPDERPGGVARLTSFLRICRAAGVERAVLLSARDWIDADLPAGHEREAAVEASGLAWTILRPAWFAQDFLTMQCFAAGVRAGRLPYNSGTGAVAFVDAADIADVAVAALTAPGHAERRYELSGLSPVTMPAAARTLSEALERPVEAVPMRIDDYAAHLRELRYDDAGVHAMVFFSRAARAGELSYLSSGTLEALGRPARSFAEFVTGAARSPSWRPRRR